ncbi:MAG: sulfatase-like hydrolase/transferase [Acidobacteriia bacterium]|nr:sulfatase-like hydrolase/transferase [Terriglobia bacterium]
MRLSNFMQALICCLCCLAAQAGWAGVSDKPNVLIVTIDTLRADHVGCYGYKPGHTPNIDSLAADGVLFKQAFTPVPITLPSHTVIFTGTYPMLNGMHDFSGNRVSRDQPTLASILKSNGYTTGAVIASAVLDSRFGLNRGFDFYYDHFDFNRLLESNLDAMERPANVVADEALRWLEQHYQKRFLLWVHLYDPHHPYNPPAPYRETFKSHPYDGEIAFADAQLGRILTFLKKKGVYGHTLIVFLADHGEGLGDHGEKNHGFFIYNSTLHVPLIFKLPAAGTRRQVTQAVSTVDVLPTILDELQIAVPKAVQGRTLAAALRGKTAEASPIYSESFLPRLHFNWSELRGLQDESYKFIDGPKPELYDLSSDPGELHNLYAAKPAVSQELQSRLGSVVTKYTQGQGMAEKTPLDPALAERLRALGYTAFAGGGDPAVSNRNLPDAKDRIEFYQQFADAMDDSQHHRYTDAVEKLKPLLKTEPESVPVRYLLGSNYYRMKRFSGAVEEFQRVVKLSPDYALANYWLGLSYAQASEYENSIASFQTTLKLDGTNFSAAFNMGAAELKLGRVEQAADAFRQSVSIYPEYAEGFLALGEVLLYQSKLDDALTQLQKAVRLEPANPHAHAVLAKALEAKGRHAEAVEEMKRAGAPQQ